MLIEVGQRYLMGSDDRCDIQLSESGVAPFHAELLKLSARHYMVRDLGSADGTVVRRDNVYLARVHRDEEIRLGGSAITLREVEEGRHGGRDPASASHYRVGLSVEHRYQVGASPDCDIVVPSSGVAWNHGTLVHTPTGWQFLPRHGGPTVTLTPDNAMHLGSRLFEMNDAHQLSHREFVNNRLDVRDVSFDTPSGQRLLNDISFSALSGQVIGIMGPSGAGKSVLLRTICGVQAPSAGGVYLFQTKVAKRPELLRSTLAYVPQDDLVMRELTVFENVRTSARLKFPRDWPPDEINDYVDLQLEKLGLYGVRNVPCGRISGGQRKRVQLAMELVTDPAFLVADEPCSGLSSWDAGNVVSLLRRMADQGRTVLFTIHSPDIDVLEKMDRLLLLDRGGRLAYFGPAYPNAMQYFTHRVVGPTESPKVIFDELERQTMSTGGDLVRQRTPEHWQAQFRGTELYRTFVERPQAWIESDSLDDEPVIAVHVPRLSKLWRGVALLDRRARRQVRDRQDLLVSLGQGPLIALAFWVVFLSVGSPDEVAKPLHAYATTEGQQAIVFLSVLTAVWFGAARGVVEIPTSWPRFEHERLSFLTPATYVLPRCFVMAATVVVQILGFGIVLSALYLLLPAWIYPGTFGDPGNAMQQAAMAGASWTGMLALTGVGSLATAMFVGSFLRSRRSAVGILPLLLIVQSLLAGYQPPNHRMWPPVRSAAEAMSSLHGFEGSVLVLERHTRSTLDTDQSAIGDSFLFQLTASRAPSSFEGSVNEEASRASAIAPALLERVKTELGRRDQNMDADKVSKAVLRRAKAAKDLDVHSARLYRQLVDAQPNLARFRYPNLGRSIARLVAIILAFVALTIASVAVAARKRRS